MRTADAQQTVEPEVLTLEQAAAFVGLKPASLRAAARNQRVASYRLGKSLRFMRTELLTWLRSGKAFDGVGKPKSNPVTRKAKPRNMTRPVSFDHAAPKPPRAADVSQ